MNLTGVGSNPHTVGRASDLPVVGVRARPAGGTARRCGALVLQSIAPLRRRAAHHRISRPDVLWMAWRQVRAGADGGLAPVLRRAAESYGIDRMLAELRTELRAGCPTLCSPVVTPIAPAPVVAVARRVGRQAAAITLTPLLHQPTPRPLADVLAQLSGELRVGAGFAVIGSVADRLDGIDRGLLLASLEEQVGGGHLLDLVRTSLDDGLLQGPTPTPAVPGQTSTPSLRAMLAEVYLRRFDREVARAGVRPVRSASDFVALVPSFDEAVVLSGRAIAVMARLGLELKGADVALVDLRGRTRGFEFAGCRLVDVPHCAAPPRQRGPRRRPDLAVSGSPSGPTTASVGTTRATP